MVMAELEASLGERFPPEVRARVERRVRVALGGDRHYIASAAAMDRLSRDRAIRDAVARGEPMVDVAIRHGISYKTVWHIVRVKSEVAP